MLQINETSLCASFTKFYCKDYRLNFFHAFLILNCYFFREIAKNAKRLFRAQIGKFNMALFTLIIDLNMPFSILRVR